jgi:hypothetical protein
MTNPVPLFVGTSNTASGGSNTRLLGSTAVGGVLEIVNSSVGGGPTGGTGVQASGGTNGIVAFGGAFGVQSFANGGPTRSFAVGVRGSGSDLSGIGVEGRATGGSARFGNAGIGVRGIGNATAVDGTGVRGEAHTGVSGVGRWGVHGVSRIQDGAGPQDFGVMGVAQQVNGNGVIGWADNGSVAYGVWGRSSSGYAGFFSGNVQVNGNLTKTGTNSFLIDHPLDPENAYLRHSSIESPEVLNFYSGNVVTDAEGRASVELPEYFEILNRDIRYQLTVIGEPALASIAQEVEASRFEVLTDRPNVKVSWQLVGVRDDPAARHFRMDAEEAKPPEARGTYLAPEAFGQPPSRGAEYARVQELSARLTQQSADKTPPVWRG